MDAKADSMIENRFFFWEPVFFIAKTLACIILSTAKATIRIFWIRFASFTHLMYER